MCLAHIYYPKAVQFSSLIYWLIYLFIQLPGLQVRPKRQGFTCLSFGLDGGGGEHGLHKWSWNRSLCLRSVLSQKTTVLLAWQRYPEEPRPGAPGQPVVLNLSQIYESGQMP